MSSAPGTDHRTSRHVQKIAPYPQNPVAQVARVYILALPPVAQGIELLGGSRAKRKLWLMTDTSVADEEVARFAALADQWWDPEGDFAPLTRSTRFGWNLFATTCVNWLEPTPVTNAS